MRLWSLHPTHLDRAGLVACWRESLLAQAVLAGETRGYRNHPQLWRLRQCSAPMSAIGFYLTALAEEAERRGYNFDGGKIRQRRDCSALIPVTCGQLAAEWAHLGRKLEARSPEYWANWQAADPSPHPLFFVTEGPIEHWEKS